MSLTSRSARRQRPLCGHAAPRFGAKPRRHLAQAVGVGLLLCLSPLFGCKGVAPELEPAPPQHLPGVLAVHSEDFATSACCAQCHGTSPESEALHDHKGRPVGPPDLWRASMMANASRDPLWQAQVALEVALQPHRRAEIEGQCLRCHAPMAVVQAELSGAPTPTMAALQAGEVAGELARDGVACALCISAAPSSLQRIPCSLSRLPVTWKFALSTAPLPARRPMARYFG